MNKGTKRALTLINKLFASGHLKITYGRIESQGTNGKVDYPLTEEETQFVYNFFMGNGKLNGKGKLELL